MLVYLKYYAMKQIFFHFQFPNQEKVFLIEKNGGGGFSIFFCQISIMKIFENISKAKSIWIRV